MFSWQRPGRLPLIVAHRGSSDRAPENTLASFRQALEDGADAIELDVRLTRDGFVVVFHDAGLNRTTGRRGLVRDCTLRELKSLSAGAWFHRRFGGERVPTLDEVLELTGGRCGLNIEIKADDRGRNGEEIVDRCRRIIRAHRALDTVLVTSFFPRIVRLMTLARPRIAAGLLYHPLRHLMKSPVSFARALGAQYLVMPGSGLRKRIIGDAHRRGILVGEYTVNSRRRTERALRFGVDALITDRPAHVLKIVRGIPPGDEHR